MARLGGSYFLNPLTSPVMKSLALQVFYISTQWSTIFHVTKACLLVDFNSLKLKHGTDSIDWG